MDEITILSGLDPNWASLFSSSPLSVSTQASDTLNPSRQLGTDRTTADTLGLMASHAYAASTSPILLNAVKQAGITQGMGVGEKLKRIFSYIRMRVKFREDNIPLGQMFKVADSKELLITPPALLSMGVPMGDCDDFSMLAVGMMIACGIGCSFVTVAADSRSPGQFTHVYVMAEGGIPFDASHGDEVGWETEKQFRKEVWPVFEGRKDEGVGMIVGRSGFEGGLRGLLGLGDTVCDASGDCYDTGTTVDTTVYSDQPGSTVPLVPLSQVSPTVNVTSSTPSSSSSSNLLASILPGIFGSAEKIAQQTTQQPGYQVYNPATGQYTSYVGSSATGIPGLSTSSLGSLMPILLILGVAMLVMEK